MLTAAVYLVGALLIAGAVWAFAAEAVAAFRAIRSSWRRRAR